VFPHTEDTVEHVNIDCAYTIPKPKKLGEPLALSGPTL